MNRQENSFFTRLKKFRWNRLDSYILKKFLGSFLLALALLMTIVVVFDLSENLNRFLQYNAPVSAIITQRYFNFIPIFANLFANLFTFISVIWFTSKLSNQNEIISIYNGGISFNRLLVPYLTGAIIIAISSFCIANFYLPGANQRLADFSLQYMARKKDISNYDLHVKANDSTYVFIGHWNVNESLGEDFSYEIIGEKYTTYKVKASEVSYDEKDNRWHLKNYVLRTIDGQGNEEVSHGDELVTTFNFDHNDFNKTEKSAEVMSYQELRKFIDSEKEKGSSLVKYYEIEKYKRTTIPFGTIIMTLLGFSVASRKTQRGVGVHIFIGLALSFIYIFFQQVSNTFAISGQLSPAIASWLPNMIYFVICLYMLKHAQK
ncbi:MAG: LptF/LptG family permease [Bacteroidales bacterium]|nr:LptF/LptG family permease [Bacteroidales bacterium]